MTEAMFRVSMYSETFLISIQSINRTLHTHTLLKLLPSFVVEVHALTHSVLVTIQTSLFGDPRPLPVYISITNFTKSRRDFTNAYSFIKSHFYRKLGRDLQ